MLNIGIITYHSAYNYGSALQALATQLAIEKLDLGKPRIIDYRTKEQKRVYSLYRTRYGFKIFFEDLLLLPQHRKRQRRSRRFEKFFDTYMNLTEVASTGKEVEQLFKKFDIIISGSDQIWNKYSLELANMPWEDMDPYLLKGFSGIKISYASSIGNMSDEEILKIKDSIEKFTSVSFREKSSAERIKKLTMCTPTEVLDPTFLITDKEWKELFCLKENKEQYLLFYGLGGLGYLSKAIKALKPFCKKRKLKLKIVMPYAYLPFQGGGVEFCSDAGPVQLLELIMNAKLVVTNSYHGTILSVNFHKEFYSICTKGGSEFRKIEILNKIGLEDRIVESVEKIENYSKQINYSIIDNDLKDLRTNSLLYLEKAIKRGYEMKSKGLD